MSNEVKVGRLGSVNGLLALTELGLAVVIFGMIYSMVAMEPIRWLLLTAFLFFTSSFLVSISIACSSPNADVEGRPYYKVYNFVGLVLFIIIPIASIIKKDYTSQSAFVYWTAMSLSVINGITHGLHGIILLCRTSS